MGKKLTNRDKQALETKRKLIQSAHHIFLQNGFDKTTISQIIKDAGVGYGTAYVYFKNKDDMFNTVMEEVMGQFFKVAKQVFQPTSIDEACQQIRDQVRAYMTVAIEERATMQVVKEAIGSSEIIESRWLEIRNEFIESITSDINYSQQKKLVSSKFDPRITAQSWYYMNEMFMWKFVEDKWLELEPIVEQLSLFYTAALYRV